MNILLVIFHIGRDVIVGLFVFILLEIIHDSSASSVVTKVLNYAQL